MKKKNEKKKLTDSCNSRTLIIDIFGADLAHHLGGDSLEGAMQRESQSRKQNAADEKRTGSSERELTSMRASHSASGIRRP